MFKVLDAEIPKHLDIIALDGKIKLRYERHGADCWLSNSGGRLSEEDTVMLEKAYQDFLNEETEKYFNKTLKAIKKHYETKKKKAGKAKPKQKKKYCRHSLAFLRGHEKVKDCDVFVCVKCGKLKNIRMV